MTDGVDQLVKRCLAGDQTAMAALVERYQSMVFSLCFRMLGQRQDAEDAAQETFVRALRSLAKWDAARGFKPWLLAIAANRCRTFLGQRLRRPTPCDVVEPLCEEQAESQAAQRLAEEVQLALTDIRGEYREAFVLFYEHELSYAEIAAALDAPLGTIKTWVHRARRELIDRLTRREVLQESRHELRRI